MQLGHRGELLLVVVHVPALAGVRGDRGHAHAGPDVHRPTLEHDGPAAVGALRGLNRGQLDCVLLAMPYGCGDIDHEILFDDRLFVAFPKGEAPPKPDDSKQPALLFEVAWEVCWQLGVIYTVLRS